MSAIDRLDAQIVRAQTEMQRAARESRWDDHLTWECRGIRACCDRNDLRDGTVPRSWRWLALMALVWVGVVIVGVRTS